MISAEKGIVLISWNCTGVSQFLYNHSVMTDRIQKFVDKLFKHNNTVAMTYEELIEKFETMFNTKLGLLINN